MDEKPQKRKRKLNLQKPSGTIDFFPEEMEKRRWLVRVIEDLFRKFGLEQIEIPMYDFFELYKVRSGEEILNDIFTFYDPPKHRAAEDPALYALRPEFTASLARAYISSEMMYRPKPQKYYYISQIVSMRPSSSARSRNPCSFRERVGWRIFRRGLASICRTLSLVTLNTLPTSSRVRG